MGDHLVRLAARGSNRELGWCSGGASGPGSGGGSGPCCRAYCLASQHASFQDGHSYDLLAVILDMANSEIYYAQPVEVESTRMVMLALRN